MLSTRALLDSTPVPQNKTKNNQTVNTFTLNQRGNILIYQGPPWTPGTPHPFFHYLLAYVNLSELLRLCVPWFSSSIKGAAFLPCWFIVKIK